MLDPKLTLFVLSQRQGLGADASVRAHFTRAGAMVGGMQQLPYRNADRCFDAMGWMYRGVIGRLRGAHPLCICWTASSEV